jgi:hypothetical protein
VNLISAVLFDQAAILSRIAPRRNFLAAGSAAIRRPMLRQGSAAGSGAQDCRHDDVRGEFITHSPTCIPLLDFVEMI